MQIEPDKRFDFLYGGHSHWECRRDTVTIHEELMNCKCWRVMKSLLWNIWNETENVRGLSKRKKRKAYIEVLSKVTDSAIWMLLHTAHHRLLWKVNKSNNGHQESWAWFYTTSVKNMESNMFQQRVTICKWFKT